LCALNLRHQACMTAASCCAADARGAADGGAQHKRESAPTLDALAARSASYSPAAAGGSGAAAPPAGDPLADLTRLGEQLAAMGGGGGGGGEGGVLHSLHPPCTDIVPCTCRFHAGGPCRRRRRGALRGLACGHTCFWSVSAAAPERCHCRRCARLCSSLFVPATGTPGCGMFGPGSARRASARRQRLRRQRSVSMAGRALRLRRPRQPPAARARCAVQCQRRGRHAQQTLTITVNGGAAGGAPGGGSGGGGGGGGDSGFAEMADLMLRQLLSKEVLLQPMMDIGAKYPAWLDAHRRAPGRVTLFIWTLHGRRSDWTPAPGHPAALDAQRRAPMAINLRMFLHKPKSSSILSRRYQLVRTMCGPPAEQCHTARTALPCRVSAWPGPGTGSGSLAARARSSPRAHVSTACPEQGQSGACVTHRVAQRRAPPIL